MVKLRLELNLLSGDRLTRDVFAGLPRLSELTLGGNPIVSLEQGTFDHLAASLVSLSVKNARLTCIRNATFARLAHLQKLGLAQNQIELLEVDAFVGLTTLRFLDLKFNKISTLRHGTFRTLNKLVSLAMGYNNIMHLAPASFAGLQSLHVLLLEHSQLSQDDLTPGTFAGLGALAFLQLWPGNDGLDGSTCAANTTGWGVAPGVSFMANGITCP